MDYKDINPNGEYHKGSNIFVWTGFLMIILWFEAKTFSWTFVLSGLIMFQ